MKKVFFLILGLCLPFLLMSQNEFKSKRFNYSFSIAGGWYIKDKIFDPQSDVKLTNGKGDLFVVKINVPNMSNTKTAKEVWGNMTTKQIDSSFSVENCKAKVLEKGTLTVDGKEFYYIFSLKQYDKDTKYYCRSYYLYEKSLNFIINTISSDPVKEATKSDIDDMVKSIDFK
ncbi:MAG: hypothetical protein WCL06_04945 [Bacteroidota bacterium]